MRCLLGKIGAKTVLVNGNVHHMWDSLFVKLNRNSWQLKNLGIQFSWQSSILPSSMPIYRTSNLAKSSPFEVVWHARTLSWASGRRGGRRGAQRIQRRSLEVVGSNHTAAQRLSSNWLGGRITSPRNGTWRFGSVNKELLSNWLGGRVIPPQEILRGIFVFICNCHAFSDLIFLSLHYSIYEYV